MTPRHHLSIPWSNLGTSTFHHSCPRCQNVTVRQGFPLSHGKIVDTIVIYAKNHGGSCREWLESWTWALDNMGQRGPWPTDRRNPPWPPEGPPSPLTWRRVLRTMTPRHHWSGSWSILRSSIFYDFYDFWKTRPCPNISREVRETAWKPS